MAWLGPGGGSGDGSNDRNYLGQPGVEGGSFLTPDAFNQMITDASSFSLTIDSGTRNAIQWITAKDRILIGTTGGEWYLSGHGPDKPITPTSYSIKPQTVWGSKDMQPLVLHEAVLFVDYVGRKLRELVWDGRDERYHSPNLMLLAEHLTLSGGITTMAYQKNPDSIIWATLANGDLISCTYDKSQDGIAWARHPMSLGSEIDEDEDAVYIPPVSTDYPLLYGTTAQDDPQLPHVTAISNVEELQTMSDDKAGNYYLTCDIDASDTLTWNSGKGFDPVGTSAPPAPFTGTFDGCGYTISDLYIYRVTEDYNGLFGKISGTAKIANVTLTDCDITGEEHVGAIVGQCVVTATDAPLIQNCHSSGDVKAGGTAAEADNFGGIIGDALGDNDPLMLIEIYDCSSSCTMDMTNTDSVLSGERQGGFVGRVSNAIVKNCFATGNVTSKTTSIEVGGFAGRIGGQGGINMGEISYCYATGNVVAREQVGGFAGIITQADGEGFVRKCYATGNATGSSPSDEEVGGFAGKHTSNGEVTDCYARGSATVPAGNDGGGFFGDGSSVVVTNCYSIGVVSAGSVEGGFMGVGSGTETSCYWDTETSGQATSGGDEVGKTTVQMKTQSTFTNWDFDDIWYMAGSSTWLDSTNSHGIGANSVCVIPGTTEDEVWLTVGRAINGNLVRYVERMKPRNWGDDQEDCFFVDSGLTYDGDATTTFTGLEHLEGETVAILGDGAVFTPQVVTGGTLPEALPHTVSVCHIGLPYTYKLKPMRMDQNYSGTSKGSVKKIHEAVISFYKTLNAQYGDGTDTYDIDFRMDEPYTTPPDLYTGDKVVTADGGFSVEDPFQIEGSDPLPCTVRCIIPRIEKTGV